LNYLLRFDHEKKSSALRLRLTTAISVIIEHYGFCLRENLPLSLLFEDAG
jgi:hypothetical protein